VKVKYNHLGNIHLPKIMADSIGLKDNDYITIECVDNKIILSNPQKMRSRDEIKQFIAKIMQYDDDITKGMIQMAEWILYEDRR